MLASSCAACSIGQPPPDVSLLDLGYYQCNVQPIFDRSCAFTACHGNPGRPLFIYSASKTRIAGDQLIGESLTDKELCANFYRAAAFATPDPRDSQLITKPKTLDGYESQFHEGNYLFSENDPEEQCFEHWMRGGRQATGTSTASLPCHLPWRVAVDGTPATCTPRALDCESALTGPDLPEVMH